MAKARKKSAEDSTAAASFVKGGGLVRHQKLSLSVDLSSRMISGLLGWWSIDKGSREEQARLYHEGASGYNTFSGYPPEVVKKMPKKAALGEQTEITKFSQKEYLRLQIEKILCRVCFEREISVVLLPCRRRVLCSNCCEKCKKRPICRASIEERLPVYDV